MDEADWVGRVNSSQPGATIELERFSLDKHSNISMCVKRQKAGVSGGENDALRIGQLLS